MPRGTRLSRLVFFLAIALSKGQSPVALVIEEYTVVERFNRLRGSAEERLASALRNGVAHAEAPTESPTECGLFDLHGSREYWTLTCTAQADGVSVDTVYYHHHRDPACSDQGCPLITLSAQDESTFAEMNVTLACSPVAGGSGTLWSRIVCENGTPVFKSYKAAGCDAEDEVVEARFKYPTCQCVPEDEEVVQSPVCPASGSYGTVCDGTGDLGCTSRIYSSGKCAGTETFSITSEKPAACLPAACAHLMGIESLPPDTVSIKYRERTAPNETLFPFQNMYKLYSDEDCGTLEYQLKEHWLPCRECASAVSAAYQPPPACLFFCPSFEFNWAIIMRAIPRNKKLELLPEMCEGLRNPTTLNCTTTCNPANAFEQTEKLIYFMDACLVSKEDIERVGSNPSFVFSPPPPKVSADASPVDSDETNSSSANKLSGVLQVSMLLTTALCWRALQ